MTANAEETAQAMAVDYTIVVPAFNEEALLPSTLAALHGAMQAQPALRGEIVVVDNNSADGTADVARAGGARVVFEPVNQISRARNAGATAADGRYLVFVDADTRIGPELLQAALNALESGGVCGGGALAGTSEAVRPLARCALRIWNLLATRCHYAAGAFVYCRRDGWAEVGGFSLDLYASEEIAFSRALRLWGRTRGLAFVVLPIPFDTSMRKLRWYGPLRRLAMTLPLLLMPWRLRSRDRCAVWYDRPADQGEQP
jgi:glycosyltransferase involved in cell wall biosynthesis